MDLAREQGAGGTACVFKKVASEGKLPLRLWVMIRDSNERMARRRTGWSTGTEAPHDPSHQALDRRRPRLARGVAARAVHGPALQHGAGNDAGRYRRGDGNACLGERLSALRARHRGPRQPRGAERLRGAFKANPAKKDLRRRIEHAQHLHPADIPRFGKLGVIASMQGIHCTSDAVFVPARLGAKRSEEGAYVWQKLMKSGAIVTNGTDAPSRTFGPCPTSRS